MAKKPYKPSYEELQKSPPRVVYELKMFFASLNACSKLHQLCHKALNEGGTWTQEDDDLRKSTLESTLLHARNLLDFLTGNPTRKDDIRAAHFLPNSEDCWWKSNKLELLSTRRDDLNFSISHLTYRRTTKDRPKWDLQTIADEVHAAFDEFISLLPKSEQSRWKL